MEQKTSIFIINLEKDIQRREHMKLLCKEYKLKYHFVKAIDGAELDKNTVVKVCDQKACIRSIDRELTINEIGCALSHLSIYNKMIDENIENALIFEDDILIEQAALVSLMDSLYKLPNDWELVLLGNHQGIAKDYETQSSIWSKKKISNTHKLLRPIKLAYGAHGYLINLRGAKKLAKELQIIKQPLDHYTGSEMFVNLYTISPRIIRLQHTLHIQSNLEVGRLLMKKKYNINKKKKFISKVGRELFRPFKRGITNIENLYKQVKFPKGYSVSKDFHI